MLCMLWAPSGVWAGRGGRISHPPYYLSSAIFCLLSSAYRYLLSAVSSCLLSALYFKISAVCSRPSAVVCT
jgi:hypothetical protein